MVRWCLLEIRRWVVIRDRNIAHTSHVEVVVDVADLALQVGNQEQVVLVEDAAAIDVELRRQQFYQLRTIRPIGVGFTRRTHLRTGTALRRPLGFSLDGQTSPIVLELHSAVHQCLKRFLLLRWLFLERRQPHIVLFCQLGWNELNTLRLSLEPLAGKLLPQHIHFRLGKELIDLLDGSQKSAAYLLVNSLSVVAFSH